MAHGAVKARLRVAAVGAKVMVLWKYLSHISLPSVLAPLSGWPVGTPDLLLACVGIFSQLSSNSSRTERKAVQYTLLKP